MLYLRQMDKWPRLRNLATASGRKVLEILESSNKSSTKEEIATALDVISEQLEGKYADDVASEVLHATTQGLADMALSAEYADIPVASTIGKAFKQTAEGNQNNYHARLKEDVLCHVFRVASKDAKDSIEQRQAIELFDTLAESDPIAAKSMARIYIKKWSPGTSLADSIKKMEP